MSDARTTVALKCKIALCSTILNVALFNTPVLAEQSLTIGVAGSFETNSLEGEDDSFGVAPIAQYQNDSFLGGFLSIGFIEASYQSA